jgi:hypothetical protein
MSYNPSVAATYKVLRPSTLQIVNGTYDIAAEQNTLRQQNNNQLVLMCDLTLNTATSVEIKIQVAHAVDDIIPAAADWYDLAYSGSATVAAAVATIPLSTGVYQMTATGKLAIPVPTCYRWIRALAKTTGAVGSTTLEIRATQGMA